MSFTVVVKQEAHEDTIKAYNYYEEKQSGLGEGFWMPYCVGIRNWLNILLFMAI